MDAFLEHDLVHSVITLCSTEHSHCMKRSLELYDKMPIVPPIYSYTIYYILIYNHVLNDEKSDMLCE